MVALKDKRKWTLTEYKGEHECCSGDDVSYHSFHDASRDVGCHSSTCATSSLFGGVWGFFLPSLGDESNFLLFKVKKVGPLNTPRQENYRSNLQACFCAALCVHLLYNLLLYWRIWRACVCQGVHVALQDMEKHVIVIWLFCSWLDGPHTSCTAAPAPFSSRNYSLYLLSLRSGPTTEQVAVYPMPSIWLYWSGQ